MGWSASFLVRQRQAVDLYMQRQESVHCCSRPYRPHFPDGDRERQQLENPPAANSAKQLRPASTTPRCFQQHLSCCSISKAGFLQLRWQRLPTFEKPAHKLIGHMDFGIFRLLPRQGCFGAS